MNIISKSLLTVFELINELYIAFGSGFLGLGLVLTQAYRTNTTLSTITVGALSFGSFLYILSGSETRKPSRKQVIFITGCDSGLGFSLLHYLSELGFTVIGGFLSLESPGAQKIAKGNHVRVKQVECNVLDDESVSAAIKYVTEFIEYRSGYELHGVINNAAVMVFGEFEWQTQRLIEEQVNVNLIGMLRITKNVAPLLRKYRGRLVNVTSHCAEASLPGLAVYGATKSAISAFSDALRVELAKYGVPVVQVIPGSFVMHSDIMARHPKNVLEMHRNFSREQHLFYEDYFQRYNAYLLGIKAPDTPQKLDNRLLYRAFKKALLLHSPKDRYKVEPLRYGFYHFLFRWTPTPVRDFLVERFIQMPEYKIDQNW